MLAVVRGSGTPSAGTGKRGAFVRIRWIAAVPSFVALLAAAPAFGASANVTNFNNKVTAIYEAGSGEVNHVVVSGSASGVTFTDPGITISEGTGCTSSGIGTITCRSASPIEQLRVDVEDGADSATNNTSLPSTMFGGEALDNNHDVLKGGSGPDVLLGGNGNDTLSGNGGNDEVRGEGNSDTLFGNDGKDLVIGDDLGDPSGANTLSGGTGGDTLISSKEMGNGFGQNVSGGDGTDFLYGASGPDTLSGGAGVDLLSPGFDGQPDVLNGGADNDIADYLSNNTSSAIQVTLDNVANDGVKLNNTDNVKSDIETVWGGPLDDSLTGTSGAQTLNGFGGNDTLDGATGPDLLFGGGGVDRVTYASRVTQVTATIDGAANDGVAGENDNVETDVENLTGGQHDDTLAGDGDKNQLDGGDGGDQLNGLGGDDTLNGEGSNDTFVANAGADTMNGGVGFDTADYSGRAAPQNVSLDSQANDGSAGEKDNVDVERVFGGTGPDQLTGDANGNSLEGRGNADTVSGGGGVDVLDGGNGVDTIQGGDGGDIITNGAAADGADSVAGGPGIDLSNYATRMNPVKVSLDDVANDGQVGENDDVKSSVEKVFGGSAADVLTGSAADNVLAGGGAGDTIAGGPGDDILNGNAGTDAMFGGDNNDTLQGGAGADAMGGGPGVDKADYSDALTGIDVTLDDVANDGAPAEGDNVGTTIENVLGGRFNDTIQGDGDANGLVGGLGADTLKGAPGPDVITGGSGMDILVGGAGADQLHAVDGTQDTLLCGPEVDSYAADGTDLVGNDCENALP